MTTEETNQKKAAVKKAKESRFTCRFCGKSKPISELRVINRFSPPLVACRDCEKKNH
ncbi:MAG: hypothetical protein V1780_02250 [Chloroflexota bacterium]